MDKSQITKQRRSLEHEDYDAPTFRGNACDRDDTYDPRLPQRDVRRGREERSHIRERSLSPYSRRLALTQAMNM
ncbi:hypothetical protein Z517_10708 [Fonsecaea pedrosoi CBS 271.37]|uniref:Unplaced genomic scaffold supercont1.7, whole genome shotgun sequence n=1 Tax=Fonsecaea pedrosoi CBS 271.37 TaxID=1442368 RepID=A0A0D2G5P2_9EURO|nr:uncharacterized protein Z517_10708 [Fonsecaea pedrosoi CBS 271.37]KIW75963.1 hypothetical protein Z517_10708 [Fonsecaea pedrosoi CBS 271.37]